MFANVTRNARSIASSVSRFTDSELQSKATDEVAITGTEGLHRADSAVVPVQHVANGPVRGDWVLFHPVYSPEELKAVQVSICD